MKPAVIFLFTIATVLGAYGQGMMSWGNNVTGFRAPIYGPDPNNPGLSQTGQSAVGNPAGSVVYAGALLQGTGYTFTIFGGPQSAASNSLTLVASTVFRTSTTNNIPAGLVAGGTTSIPGVAPGERASFQIRVPELPYKRMSSRQEIERRQFDFQHRSRLKRCSMN